MSSTRRKASASESVAPPAHQSAIARRVFPTGKEPNTRFTLANERTFLAWIRTSLAFVAGGVALEAFEVGNWDPVLRKSVAIAVIAMGLLIGLGAAFRWLRVERAMRHDHPLPVPLIIPVLALIAAAGSGAAVGLVMTN